MCRSASGIWLAVLALGIGTPARAQGPGTPAVAGRIARFDPRLDALVPPGARLETVVTGHDWLEGPVWERASGCLLFSDIPRNAVYRWCEGRGEAIALTPSGYTGHAPFTGKEPGSNGLALDARGRLVLAEHGDRRISRLDPDGRKVTLADRLGGRRLNSPNDLIFDAAGDLLFTDPPWGLPQWWDDPAKELSFSGVYRLTPDGALTILSRSLDAPNGLGLAPGGRTLVVTESRPGRFAWHTFDVRNDGSLAGPRLLLDAEPWAAVRPGAPDGLEFDRDGHLFGAGPGGVYVLTLDGTLLGIIETGRATSNVAWGGDGSDLYITAGSDIYRLRTGTRGPIP